MRPHTKLRLAGKKLAADRAAALAEMPTWKGKTVLDIGCGTGETAYLIARRGARRVLGIDYAPGAIAVAEKNYQAPNLSFAVRDVRDVAGEFLLSLLDVSER